ncbi:MAG: DUF429 domain-containing protein [Anaerolinea sp.]|nr:DUF429 domain-containing protein [Anaerolinea sp.]
MLRIDSAIGVDFSGGIDAGRKIWIAEGRISGGQLHVLNLQRACELPGGAEERGVAITALRDWIAAQPGGTLIGCDFPFSLARSMLRHSTWDAFAAAFGGDYPQAEALFEAGRAAGSPYRQTDREARTPFAPCNLRLYRQTYYGIRDLLAPIAAAGQARILPFHDPTPELPGLIEVCPASLLKARRWYLSYKGPDRQPARAQILDRLIDSGVVISDTFSVTVLDDAGGDALDSVIAAVCAAHAVDQIAQPVDALSRLEGRVYY